MNRRALRGKAPREKGAAVYGVFEPLVQFVRHIAVQEDFDGLFQFAGEFADLQTSHMRRRFPVHMARTLEGFVGAYAIEVAAQSAIVRFDFTRNPGQQIVKSGLRVHGGIDHHFPRQGDARGLLQEAEGESGGEGEAVLPVRAAAWKPDVHHGLQRRPGRDQRKVNAGFHGGASFVANRLHADGKRGQEPLVIAHEEARRHAASGGNVLRYLEIQRQARQAQSADQAADQQGRHHGCDNQEKQVVRRYDGAEGHQQDREGEQHSAAGDFVPNPACQKRAKMLPGSAHGGWFDCTPLRYNFLYSPPSDDKEKSDSQAGNMSRKNSFKGWSPPQPSPSGTAPATDVPPKDRAQVEQLIANGKLGFATEIAKQVHKRLGSAASEGLLVDAYAARISSLAERNLDIEAGALLEQVEQRHPTFRDRLREVAANLQARRGGVDGLLGLLADASLPADKRAGIETRIRAVAGDPARIARCEALPPEHPLRVAAGARLPRWMR